MKKQILSALLSLAVAASCCGSVMADYENVGTNGAYLNGASYVKVKVWEDNLDSYADKTALTGAWKGNTDYITLSDGAVTLASTTDFNFQTEFYKDVNVDCTSAPIVVTQDVTFSDNTSERRLMYLWNWRNDDIPSTAIDGLVAANDGYFKIGENAVMPYSAGTYTIQTIVDTTADTAEYIINGKSVGTADIPETFEKIVRYTPIKQNGSESMGTVTVDNMIIHKLASGIGQETNLIKRNGKNYSVNTILADDFTTLDTSVWLGNMTSVKVDDAHGNSMQLKYNGADAEVYRNLSGALMNDSSGVYMFRADYKFSDTTSSRFIMEAKDAGVYIKSDWDNIRNTSGTALALSTTDWFTLSQIIDLKNKVFEYYLDDVLIWSGELSDSYLKSARITLGKQRGGNGNEQTLTIDNFGMYKLNEHYTDTRVEYKGVKYDGLEIDSDNFNSYEGKAGENGPDGWFASMTAGADYVESTVYDSLHGSSAKLTKVTNDAQMYKDYSSGLFGDDKAMYLISTDYMFTSYSQRRIMIIKDSAYGDLQLFRAESNGQFKSCDNSPVAAAYGAYELNKWYRIQMLVDVANQKYSIYVNGTLLADGLDLPKTVVNLNRITPVKERGAGSSVIVDNYSLCKLSKSIDNALGNAEFTSIYSDGFEPEERTTLYNAANTMSYVTDNGSYVMKLSDADNIKAYTAITPEKAYEKYLFTQNIKFSDTTQSRYIFVMNFTDGTNYKDVLSIRTNGANITDANTGAVLAGYKANTWYKVQLLLNTSENTYDAYLNGAYIGSGSYEPPMKNGTLCRVDFVSSWGETHNDVYLDNLSIVSSEEWVTAKEIFVKAYGNPLTALSTLMDGDEITVEPTFDTTGASIIIAIYNKDNTLNQVVMSDSMTLQTLPAENSYLRAFVFNSETMAAECGSVTVNY